MPTPTFMRISLKQFESLLINFPFTRHVTSVHMHHTWRPDRKTFKGHDSIVSMWRYHTQEMGWRDIAQHVSIDPDGYIWLGRNWNLPPASAAGYNGNAKFGPFMFEMIGNFDKGCDPFDGPQRDAALDVVAMVQARFGLAANTLQFHNAMSAKSCPGSSLDYTRVLQDVDQRRTRLAERTAAPRGLQESPFPDERDPTLDAALDALNRPGRDVVEPADAELPHQGTGSLFEESIDQQERGEGTRQPELTPETIAALRPYLIDLSMGHFSRSGRLSSSPADVDVIFEQHLPQALENAMARSAQEERKLRLLFYAHGGLVSELSGLHIAAKHIEWWVKNGIYPIYFIWETGFCETVGNLLTRAAQGTMRGMRRDLWDYTLDPLIELAARALGGPRIWGGMKASAAAAVDLPTSLDPIGGSARYAAQRLKAFCDAHKEHVELHAIGHSAGSIFHSHFLQVAHELGVPTFKSAHFLAPAVRTDAFKELLAPQIGDGKAVEKLILFTMKKDFERADNCAGVYHKSLLYLIYHALEAENETPILGLEESLRRDPDLKALFGLAGTASARGEVVWSVTRSDTGASASTSRSHLDFDDDAPTMNSLARRLLGKADAAPIIPYEDARALALPARPWIEQIDWPEELARLRWIPATPEPAATSFMTQAPNGCAASPVAGAPPCPGQQRALCVGINRYPDPRHALAGCVADAQMWAAMLTRLGFTASLLIDERATREGIARSLLELVQDSRSGDVIVFQYSGHGTMVPDLNGDEDDGQDEAICPVDFSGGALYIDDDIAQVFERMPEGVNLTCFMDCCHSGTNSRFAAGVPDALPRPGLDERKRYVLATPELIAAHTRYRERMGATRRVPGTGGRSLMRDIKFAACLDSEVAWESQGHGEFTLRATQALASAFGTLSNEQFLQRVTTAFGPSTRQHPMLDCTAPLGAGLLLHPVLHREAAAMPDML